ncbi:DNA replication and repair protein RecN [Tepidamorphus gemmatus]|uniref:DNA repair protein RecN n=1 Tax=Tepidamorphus gemmatus TaxID=747076 RepID=A0A4R3MI24_9HYPH|nr:DNA repair protein RecN [Tepidamorphus gemmatus]TCT13511.1 DNA replication and repair protein RecN [Tepidamorphus gemmatus]
MLAALSIRDIVIIDRLEIAFGPGLSALTGETGAGKSILLDSLSLALGGRGDASLVRRGAEQGQVVAAFDLPPGHPAFEVLRAQGLDSDGELVLRRIQTADGRTRAYVNDQPASVQLLRTLGALLVEIHGQHDDRALVDPAVHRRLLDSFGGLEADVAALGGLWERRRRAEAELAAAQAEHEAAARDRDYLAHALEELDALAPQPGEEAHLADRRQVMMQSEKLAEELSEAAQSLGGSTSAVPLLSAALRRLERRAAQFPALLGPTVAGLEASLNALEDARLAVDRALAEIAFDPRELEATEERLFALRAAARKHQVPVDGLSALREQIAGRLAALELGGERVAALETAAAEAAAAYDRAATLISQKRIKAAKALDRAVMAELPALKLERARFETRIETADGQGGPEGRDRVEFWVQTNPGSHAGPILKVASGGELSRFLLALKVALAEKGSAPTLVFDEIDTAVGGAVSDAIGVRLRRLAEKVQVLTVTHAPQVAARATSHLLIRKEPVKGGDVVTRVDPLDPGRRREEIARMLAGATVTDEARAAAGRLLEGMRT